MTTAKKCAPNAKFATLATVTCAQLGAMDAQLAAFGLRSKSTLFSYRIRLARAILAPLAGAFYAERAAVLKSNVKQLPDGSYDVQDAGNGAVRFGFLDGRAEAGLAALTELMGAPVELPASLKPLTAAEIDAAGVIATEAELEALGPLLDMSPESAPV